MSDEVKSPWEKFWAAITFARFFRLVLLFLLAALIYSIWSGGIGTTITGLGQWFDHAGEVNFARGLITFLIVAATITIALLLVSFGLYSRTDEKDTEFWKLKFSLSKDVLTAFMGILGTIMGFYYAEDRVSTASIPTLNQTVQQTPISELEKDGFAALLAKDYTKASQSFADAYKLNFSYHNVGDINQLLKDHADQFNKAGKDSKLADPVWTEVFCAIAQRKLTIGMTDDMIGQVRKNCPTYDPGANTAAAGAGNTAAATNSSISNSNSAVNK
ncbi:MAG: hypothetical protein JO314_05510 [Acidobacteria bacterium]|nr:hypothetical protein [Acidobacteriota bacterium]